MNIIEGVTKKQLTAIFSSVAALGWQETDRKEYMRKTYGVASVHDLGRLGAERFKEDLKSLVARHNFEKDNRRKLVIAICYQKQIMLTDGFFDAEKLNSYLLKYGVVKKEFNLLTLEELSKLSYQLKQLKANG